MRFSGTQFILNHSVRNMSDIFPRLETLSLSALFPICYPQNQHANIGEMDGFYKEDG
jgi:hypothetical protein